MKVIKTLLASALIATMSTVHADIVLNPLGTYASGLFADSGAEIVAHDPATQRVFVVNAGDGFIDVVDINNPANPSLAFRIDISPYGANANSVAVHKGIVVAAVEANVKQDPGKAIFFDTDGNFLNQVTVGALPDMVTFSPNGKWVLVANEGEPNDAYTNDPEGSVSIINLHRGVASLTQAKVRTADFKRFNNATLDSSIRVFGPNASVAQDLEPEYITVSHNSKKAWVTLQENNAIGVIDIRSAKVTDLIGLGFKNHSMPGNEFDASNEDDAINITHWPTQGMYQPDAIASYRVRGKTYLLTANEGDSRDYSGFSEEERVADITLDPTAFPNAAVLQQEANLGRLKITNTLGDDDNDGDFDRLFSYGARSFTIWTSDGQQVFDSGSNFETITAAILPEDFNSDDEENGSFDARSDDKGPEPEGVVIGKVHGRQYAFIGLERVGGIAVYDVTAPAQAEFVEYINTRDFAGDPAAGTAGDLSPEGLAFIKKSDSPTGKPLLVVGYEVSGTTTIYEILKK